MSLARLFNSRMAHLPLIRPPEASGKLKSFYDGAFKRAGYVAQILQVMSHDAETARTSAQFYVSLMHRENGLSRARKEMLATVVSHANDCYY